MTEWTVTHRFDSEADAIAFANLTEGMSGAPPFMRMAANKKRPVKDWRLVKIILEFMLPGRSYTHQMIADHIVENDYRAGSAGATLSKMAAAGLVRRLEQDCYQKVTEVAHAAVSN